eukprot:Awhi_evm1s1440
MSNVTNSFMSSTSPVRKTSCPDSRLLSLKNRYDNPIYAIPEKNDRKKLKTSPPPLPRIRSHSSAAVIRHNDKNIPTLPNTSSTATLSPTTPATTISTSTKRNQKRPHSLGNTTTLPSTEERNDKKKRNEKNRANSQGTSLSTIQKLQSLGKNRSRSNSTRPSERPIQISEYTSNSKCGHRSFANTRSSPTHSFDFLSKNTEPIVKSKRLQETLKEVTIQDFHTTQSEDNINIKIEPSMKAERNTTRRRSDDCPNKNIDVRNFKENATAPHTRTKRPTSMFLQQELDLSIFGSKTNNSRPRAMSSVDVGYYNINDETKELKIFPSSMISSTFTCPNADSNFNDNHKYHNLKRPTRTREGTDARKTKSSPRLPSFLEARLPIRSSSSGELKLEASVV